MADGAGAARRGRAVGAGRPRGRVRAAAGRGRRAGGRRAAGRRAGDRIELGPGVFDRRPASLPGIGALALDGPRLDLWRAPTTTTAAPTGRPPAAGWRAAGLHRPPQRVAGSNATAKRLVVRARVAPAAAPTLGLAADLRWTRRRRRARLRGGVDRRANGPSRCRASGCGWRCPAALRRRRVVRAGPGEAYADTAPRCASAGSPPPWTSSRRPTSFRRRTATARKSAGPTHRRRRIGLRVEGRPHVDLHRPALDQRTPRPRPAPEQTFFDRGRVLPQPRLRPAGPWQRIVRPGGAPGVPARASPRRLRFLAARARRLELTTTAAQRPWGFLHGAGAAGRR